MQRLDMKDKQFGQVSNHLVIFGQTGHTPKGCPSVQDWDFDL